MDIPMPHVLTITTCLYIFQWYGLCKIDNPGMNDRHYDIIDYSLAAFFILQVSSSLSFILLTNRLEQDI